MTQKEGAAQTEAFLDAPESLPWHAAVLLPSSILDEPSPSARHDIDEHTEKVHRAWGCTLICEAGVLLKLPQVAIATAQNLFHRFYWRQSLKSSNGFDAFTLAMGCLFLATKVEEHPRTLRQLLYVFHHLYRKRKFRNSATAAKKQQQKPGMSGGQQQPVVLLVSSKDARKAPLELGGERYTQWKKKLIGCERWVLKELGFGFYQVMEHPHKFLLYFIKFLSQHGMECDEATQRRLAQHAWDFLNDSMRLDLCVRHSTKDICCAAMLVASRQDDVGVVLPGPEWMLALGADPRVVHAICDKILEGYSLEVPAWLEPLHQDSYLCAKRQELFDLSEEGGEEEGEGKGGGEEENEEIVGGRESGGGKQGGSGGGDVGGGGKSGAESSQQIKHEEEEDDAVDTRSAGAAKEMGDCNSNSRRSNSRTPASGADASSPHSAQPTPDSEKAAAAAAAVGTAGGPPPSGSSQHGDDDKGTAAAAGSSSSSSSRHREEGRDGNRDDYRSSRHEDSRDRRDKRSGGGGHHGHHHHRDDRHRSDDWDRNRRGGSGGGGGGGGGDGGGRRRRSRSRSKEKKRRRP